MSSSTTNTSMSLTVPTALPLCICTLFNSGLLFHNGITDFLNAKKEYFSSYDLECDLRLTTVIYEVNLEFKLKHCHKH